MGIHELFYPKGIALFGSVSEDKLGGVLIRQILAQGFQNIYAINPKAQNYKDVPGFAHVSEIQRLADLAVIASPAATVPQIMEEIGQAGFKAAIIISSGFSEAGNADDEAEVKRIADQYGIRFIGPNCAGLLNTHWNLAATLQAYPPKGNTAIISQSGAVGGAIMEWAESQHLGISKFVSYGNGADLNQVEFLRYIKDDPETQVVGLYIENVNNGQEFMVALRELTAVKPVVVIKSGRTSTGQRAALSHTGSLAGSDAVYDAIFKECGAIRVNNLDEMIDLARGFQYLPLVKGTKIGIVTNSGGPGVMSADLAEELGLSVPEPSQKIKDTLNSFLPSWASTRNPIDLTVQGSGENYQKSIEVMLEEYDAVQAIFFGPPYLDTTPIAEGFLRAYRNSGKSVICALETGLNAAQSSQFLSTHMLPNFSSPERAIRTISGMAKYCAYLEKIKTKTPNQSVAPAEMRLSLPCLEPQAMEILKNHGIKTPPNALVCTESDLLCACQTIGYPIVMKVVSPTIIHKSDSGGVMLNLKNDAEALNAFHTIRKNATGHKFMGVLIYPMLKAGTELIIGLTRDAQFGPMIAFGLGGIYTEVLKDVVLHTAPVSIADAKEMIASIRSYKILQGLRGQAPADIDALAEMIAHFSQLPFAYPTLREADLNPVFAYSDSAIAVDVRLLFE